MARRRATAVSARTQAQDGEEGRGRRLKTESQGRRQHLPISGVLDRAGLNNLVRRESWRWLRSWPGRRQRGGKDASIDASSPIRTRCSWRWPETLRRLRLAPFSMRRTPNGRPQWKKMTRRARNAIRVQHRALARFHDKPVW